MRDTRHVRVFTDTNDFFNEVRTILARRYRRQVTVAEVAEYCVRHDLSVAYEEFLKAHKIISQELPEDEDEPEHSASTMLPIVG